MKPFFASLLVVFVLPVAAKSQEAERSRVEFTRMISHLDAYSDAGYLPFVEAARPEVAQVGFYGAHFWGLGHTPDGGGYPAHLPVVGLPECGQWMQRLNEQLHERDVKVVGHFNVKFLIGDPEGPDGPRGFFKFYHDLWDERELGKKPVENPLDLLEKNADGTPIANDNYSVGGMREYWGCLNNPHWRAVLKAWAKRGIERGVDGYVINYFYRHNCLCEHCQTAFHKHLESEFRPEELRERFGIEDLASHRFNEIVGWHDPAETTPLRLEMLRFSQISNQRAFDEVFVEYARSLKPDLVLAQWNHLGDFDQISGDERCMLPGTMWAKNEDYLWYSTGGTAQFTDLAADMLGDGTLRARWIRGLADDKPITLGKYEGTRIRAAIAELAANGGAPMGLYTRFQDPLARDEIVRYYDFLRRYDRLYHAARSHAEAVLLYPRSEVHKGNLEAVASFKTLGKQLLQQHVLFDVRADDEFTERQRAEYPHVLTATGSADELTGAMDISRFSAPKTVYVSASRPAEGNELVVHLVNFNRQEPAEPRSPGSGIVDEKPIAVEGITADLVLPATDVRAVRFVTPESPDPIDLAFTTSAGQLQFSVPKFLVYGVVIVEMNDGK